ncbi:hypothetical protein CHUAL_009979 [Chamberlinius hualienensis]
MNKSAIVSVVCIAAFALISASLVKRQADGGFVLPDGAGLIVGSIVGGFSCEGRIYGYYADVANRCQIFHVCVPDVLPDGTTQTRIYSFFCGNQTVFDQAQLVCAHALDATPCEQAESFYNVNENFGKTDRPLLNA